jgi:hypothetical protein
VVAREDDDGRGRGRLAVAAEAWRAPSVSGRSKGGAAAPMAIVVMGCSWSSRSRGPRGRRPGPGWGDAAVAQAVDAAREPDRLVAPGGGSTSAPSTRIVGDPTNARSSARASVSTSRTDDGVGVEADGGHRGAQVRERLRMRRAAVPEQQLDRGCVMPSL